MIQALYPYAVTTNGVTVRVSVSFQPETSQPREGRWFWIYQVRIENGRNASIQLLNRHWRITDGRGAVHIVEGSGVVGEQPVIAPGCAYDYVSGCPLATPSGQMVGHFGMLDTDGARFQASIPSFPLLGPAVSR